MLATTNSPGSYYIEPGTSDAGLLDEEGETTTNIREAVAQFVRRRGAQTELCAYVAASETVSVSDLRAYLAAKLPDYMIPSHIVQLDQIPLTRCAAYKPPMPLTQAAFPLRRLAR